MKRILSHAGACLLACSAPLVQAQSWPAKPVRWLVPFPPGNPSDITARLLADKLAASWPQTSKLARELGGKLNQHRKEQTTLGPRFRGDDGPEYVIPAEAGIQRR